MLSPSPAVCRPTPSPLSPDGPDAALQLPLTGRKRAYIDPSAALLNTATGTADIRPFRIEIDQADLDDLQARLSRTRLPQAAPGDGWESGTTNIYLAEAVARWQGGFDGRAAEARMNEHHSSPPRSTARRSTSASASPSSRPAGPRPCGGRHDTLMRRLGYDSYGIHGSDNGAMVARELGLLGPEGFLGLHVLQLFSFPSGDPTEFEKFEPRDYAGLEHMTWFQSVGGYNAMNASRPQTVAAGLSDSPVGLLAYSELFNSFGNGTSLVPLEAILTEVSVAWFANASAGMSRAYRENALAGAELRVSPACTGVVVFADDFQTIKVFAERDNTNIVHWSRFEQGGHYAALEVPDVVAADIRAFFAAV